ncbi:MAG TPA: recombinase family protein [Bacillota bacterium]|nr:recombinase family protein [Bacillota bacterium]
MRVALYARVSTDEQAREGTSIEEQKERLQAFAFSQGWNEYRLFIDEGFSAKDFNRPAFRQMKDEILLGHFQAVITTKIDRLTRHLIDLLQFVDFLDEYQCIYKSSSETFDTGSAAGRMVLQLLGVFAEFERERIAERVRDNMYHLAKQGQPISRPCFGYDLMEKKLVINPEEAKWVQTMADWFLGGLGTFQIAKRLNEYQVKTKNGGTWSAKAVRQFFTGNQMLIGNLVWNKQQRKGKKRIQNPPNEWLTVSNTHPPILESSLFQRIQEKLQQSKSPTSLNQRYRYLLSGLVRCGHCGARMIGSSVKKNKTTYIPRYICSDYQKKGLCMNHWISSEILESYILEKLYSLQREGANSRMEEKKSTNEDANFSPNREIRYTKKNIQNLEEKARRQWEAYEAQIITLEEFRVAKKRLQEEKQEWEGKLQQLNQFLEQIEEVDFGTLVQLKMEQMKNLQNRQLFDYQQNIIRELIYEIKVYHVKQIEICYLL